MALMAVVNLRILQQDIVSTYKYFAIKPVWENTYTQWIKCNKPTSYLDIYDIISKWEISIITLTRN
jgi:hypothetical protein